MDPIERITEVMVSSLGKIVAQWLVYAIVFVIFLLILALLIGSIKKLFRKIFHK